MSDDSAKRFSDEQAREILARAIEIDSRAPMTTTDDLRAIAADIGVSQASLEAALREQATALEARRATTAQRGANAVAASGIPLGLVAGSLLTASTPEAALGLMGVGLAGLAASGGIVALTGPRGTLRSFHLRNLALWGGAAAGSVVSLALTGGELAVTPAFLTAMWCVRRWIEASVVGSVAVVALRRARRPEGADPDPQAGQPAEPVAQGRWSALAKRIHGWMTRPLRRNDGRAAPPRHAVNAALR